MTGEVQINGEKEEAGDAPWKGKFSMAEGRREVAADSPRYKVHIVEHEDSLPITRSGIPPGSAPRLSAPVRLSIESMHGL